MMIDSGAKMLPRQEAYTQGNPDDEWEDMPDE